MAHEVVADPGTIVVVIANVWGKGKLGYKVRAYRVDERSSPPPRRRYAGRSTVSIGPTCVLKLREEVGFSDKQHKARAIAKRYADEHDAVIVDLGSGHSSCNVGHNYPVYTRAAWIAKVMSEGASL